MAARAAVSAFTRRHLQSLCGGGVRSITYSRRFSVIRETKLEDGKVATDHRIHGAPPQSLEKHNPDKYCFGQKMPPGLDAVEPYIDPFGLHYPFICAEPFNAKSLNLFLPRLDTNGLHYFTAHSVEEDGTITPEYYMYPPSPINNKDCFFTGASWNDLFHFRNDRNKNYLWNPTTNEVKTLPDTSYPEYIPCPYTRLSPAVIHYAMWSYNGYHELMLLAHYNNPFASGDDGFFRIELYSLRNNSWRYITLAERYESISMKHSGCVKGVFYIPAAREVGGPVSLIAFDHMCGAVYQSKIYSVPLPSRVTQTDVYHILEYNGMLSIVVYSGVEIAPSLFTRWVMVERGVWIEECCFNTYGVRGLVWSSKNGQMLYFQSLKDELMVFDCAAKEVKRLGIYCFSRRMQLCPFDESFAEEVEKEED